MAPCRRIAPTLDHGVLQRVRKLLLQLHARHRLPFRWLALLANVAPEATTIAAAALRMSAAIEMTQYEARPPNGYPSDRTMASASHLHHLHRHTWAAPCVTGPSRSPAVIANRTGKPGRAGADIAGLSGKFWVGLWRFKMDGPAEWA
jgi:hypothetical protein